MEDELTEREAAAVAVLDKFLLDHVNVTVFRQSDVQNLALDLRNLYSPPKELVEEVVEDGD